MSGADDRSLELADVIANGVYVVSERRWGLKNDTIGTALTLDGAKRLVLDAAGFTTIQKSKSDEGVEVHVDRNTEGIDGLFQWYDENEQWASDRFAPGVGEMRARWDGELTGFAVEWTRVEV